MKFGTQSGTAPKALPKQPSQQTLTLATVQEEIRYPDLDTGNYLLTLKGVPESYESMNKKGVPLGTTVRSIVTVHEANALNSLGPVMKPGSVSGIRIKSFGMFNDNADINKSSGARALRMERSLLTCITKTVGRNMFDQELVEAFCPNAAEVMALDEAGRSQAVLDAMEMLWLSGALSDKEEFAFVCQSQKKTSTNKGQEGEALYYWVYNFQPYEGG